jgi:phosphonate transport system ATP-binding protein
VMCNLHSLELARGYCDRLIGMSGGRVVFDGLPEQLTAAEAQRLYGLDGDEGSADASAMPASIPAEAPILGVPAIA